MIDLYDKGVAKYPWWPDWRGECVAIVACGPSADKVGVEKLKDRMHVVVINESYRLCPWAEMLYTCDDTWYHVNRDKLNKFNGIKISYLTKEKGVENITIVKEKDPKTVSFKHHMLFEEPGFVGSGGNSGYQAINLVAQFGATGIALVGYDFNQAGGIHWHGDHKMPLKNPDNVRFIEWKRLLGFAAPVLKAKGIDVVNCSMNSSIDSFPKMTINQTLERWSL